MHVHIDQSGHDDLSFRQNDFRAFRGKVLADSGDFSVLYENVRLLIHLICWVDNTSALNQIFHCAFPPIRTNVRSAIRTATPFCTCSWMAE